HRRLGALEPRRNLELPVDAQSARTIRLGDRQECRAPDANLRPALHHRARAGGVERHVRGTDGRARFAAPVSGDLMPSYSVAVIASESEAIQKVPPRRQSGLLRRVAPRNDASKHLEIFAVLPVGDFRLATLDLGVLAVPVL